MVCIYTEHSIDRIEHVDHLDEWREYREKDDLVTNRVASIHHKDKRHASTKQGEMRIGNCR